MDLMTILSQYNVSSGTGTDSVMSMIESSDGKQGNFEDVLKQASTDANKNDIKAEDNSVDDTDTVEPAESEQADNQTNTDEEDVETDDTEVTDENIAAEEAVGLAAELIDVSQNNDIQTTETSEIVSESGLELTDEEIVDTGAQIQTNVGDTVDAEALEQAQTALDSDGQSKINFEDTVAKTANVDLDAVDMQNSTDQAQTQLTVDTESLTEAEETDTIDFSELAGEVDDAIEVTDTQVAAAEIKTDSKDNYLDAISSDKMQVDQDNQDSLDDMNVEQLEAETSQTGLFGNKNQHSDAKMESDQTVQLENMPEIKMDNQTQTAETAPVERTLETAHTSTKVVDQISETIQSSAANGERQITIRLDPPELGSVTIKLTQEGSQLVGTLEVEKLQTRHDIERSLPELSRNLANAGIEVKKLEVNQTYESQPETQKDQTDSGQRGQWQADSDHSESQYGSGSDDSDNNEQNEYKGRSHYESSDDEFMSSSDKSLNILM